MNGRINEQDRHRVIALEAIYEMSKGKAIKSFSKGHVVAALREHDVSETDAGTAFEWLKKNKLIEPFNWSTYVITRVGIRAVEDLRRKASR